MTFDSSNSRRAALTRRQAALTLLGGAGAMALPSAAFAQARAPIKLTVGNATVSTPPYAAYNTSIPQEIFFVQEGLDVKMIGLGGATVAVQAVGVGQVDIGQATTSAPLSLLEKQPDSDIRAFYTITNGFQNPPAVLRDSPIRSLADLSGKTVGVQALANSSVDTTKALVQIAGGNGASLKFVAIGQGAEAAHALQTKRVDAAALFDGLYGQIEASGVPLRLLISDATNQNAVGFSAVLITRAGFLKDHRDALVRFGRAIAKATVFAKANPEAAVRIHWKQYPETKQRGVSDEDAMKSSLASLHARLENVYEVDGMFGNSNARQIDGYLNLMRTGGLLKMGSIGGFWEPGLVREMNNFDKDAIRKMAREWK